MTQEAPMPKTEIEREVEEMRSAGRTEREIAERVNSYFMAGNLVLSALLSRAK